jgi:hypothetical protein
MNVLKYVKKHYKTLPKSSFNSEEVVMVFVMNDSNEGWGRHSFSGYGVGKNGELYYCFSSGCSCSGSCGIEHKKEGSILEIEPTEFQFSDAPEKIDFAEMQVSFNDYS